MKKTNCPVKKCTTDLNRPFSKKDVPMINNHMKKTLNMISRQGRANQNHMRYDFTPNRMAAIKKTDNKCR